jgi:hypothetical protein
MRSVSPVEKWQGVGPRITSASPRPTLTEIQVGISG